MNAFAPANFGSKGASLTAPSASDVVPPDLAQRLRDCDEAHTRLVSGDLDVDVTAPWAGDKRTLGVRAAEGQSAADLAEQILANPSLRAENDPVDSITLLTSTGLGAELQQELALRGFGVPVYEASTRLLIEDGFTIVDGGHWRIHGRLTTTHELTITYELIRAHQAGFTYADPSEAPADAQIPVDHRADTLRLLGEAVADALDPGDSVLNLVRVASKLVAAQYPGLLWPAVMRLLRGKLGQVGMVVDVLRDPESGRWRSADVPIEVRRLFTATGRHVLDGDLGRREVDFNKPGRLLSGVAVERPEPPAPLAIWLAELAVDRTTMGVALPTANTAGDTTDLHRDLIGRLEGLNIGAQAARSWADLMVNGIRDQALPAQITAVDDVDLADEEPTADETSILAPLGGGVHHVLREVLAEKPAALHAAYDVAAHYLHDTTGETVSRDDVAGVVTADWKVATLVEVIALGHLALQHASGLEHAPAGLARQPMSVLFDSAGPLQPFLATHEAVIRAIFEPTLPGIAWDTPVGDHETLASDQDDTSTQVTGLRNAPTLGDLLAELLNPQQASGEQRHARLSGSSSAAPTGTTIDNPWLLPHINLRLASADRSELTRMAADAVETASLLNALDDIAPADLLQSLLTAATRSAAVARLRDLFAAINISQPRSETAAHTALRGLYQHDVAAWLAPALAALPPWNGPTPDSPQRVGAILNTAHAIDAARSDWTAPALAAALNGEWRDVSADGLRLLPEGTVTLVWVQRAIDPEHVILAERTKTGLTLVETLTPAGAEILLMPDGATAHDLFNGPIRVVVDDGDRIIALAPSTEASGVLPRPPAATPATSGLVAPNFGGPVPGAAPGAVQGMPGVTRLATDSDLAVIIVDGQKATIDQVENYVANLSTPGVMVWHGPTNQAFDYHAIAEPRGLFILEPARSLFPEAVTVARTGGYLVSPTGWLIRDPHGRSRADDRGALSGTDLLTLFIVSRLGPAGPPPPLPAFPPRPRNVPPTGPIVQKEHLRAVVEQVSTIEAPDESRCEVQVQALRALLQPTVRPARSLEEADAASSAATARLLPTHDWQEQVTWVEAESTMRAAAPGSTMLFVWQRTHGIGHAFALHRTESDIWWLEPGADDPTDRLRSEMPQRPSLYTRAVMIDPEGNIQRIPLAHGGTLAEALTDPPTGRTFGVRDLRDAGFEGETPFRTTIPKALLEEQQIQEFAKSNNLDVHLDSRGNDVIIELVPAPFNFPDRENALRPFERESKRLAENSGKPLLESFYSHENGFSILEDSVAKYQVFGVVGRAMATRRLSASDDHDDPLHDIYVQHTIAVRLAVMYQFLSFAGKNTHEESRIPLVDAGRSFADEVMQYFKVEGEIGDPRDFKVIRDAMEIRGLMSIVYTHVVALALDAVARLRQEPEVLWKNYLLAVSRFSVTAMRKLLSDRGQGWLEQNETRIATHLEAHAEKSILGLAELRPMLGGVSFLDMRVHVGDGSIITPRDLLRNALMPPSSSNIELTQERIFGVRSNVTSREVSRGGDPRILVELRAFGRSSRVGIEEIRREIDQIAEFIVPITDMVKELSSFLRPPAMSFSFSWRQDRLNNRGRLHADTVAQWIVRQKIYNQHVANAPVYNVIVEAGGNNKTSDAAATSRAADVVRELTARVERWSYAAGIPHEPGRLSARNRGIHPSESPHADQRQLAAGDRRQALVWLETEGEFNIASTPFGSAAEDGPRRELPSDHTNASLISKYPWITAINPGREAGGEYMTNCVVAAISFELAWREQQPVQTATTEALLGIDLIRFQRQSLDLADDQHQAYRIPDIDAAANALRAAPPNSRALIAVRDSAGAVGHVLTGIKDDLGIAFIDPQTGRLGHLLPNASALAFLPLTPQIPEPPRSWRMTPHELGLPAEPTTEQPLDVPTASSRPVTAPGAAQAEADRASESVDRQPSRAVIAARGEENGINHAGVDYRTLRTDEIAAPPESVGNMSRIFEEFAAGVARQDLPVRLVERRFPAGLRLSPSNYAETTDTAAWVADRLNDPTNAGVHRPQSWAEFRDLIDRAGESGMVLTLPEPGREPTVFTKTAGRVWRIGADVDGVHTQIWTEPPALSTEVEEPPLMVLAFNKCADFLL